MRRGAVAAITALTAVLAGTSSVAGQRLLDDWLVRTGAGPAALQTGPAAAFWNPAGLAAQRTRASVVLLEMLAPEATGVDGLALAGGWRLDERTTVSGGYQHFSVGEMDRTETSPEGTRLDIAQDLFVAAAARQLNERLHVGASAHFLHSSAALATPDQVSLGLGARYELPLPVPALATAYAQAHDERVIWGAGVELAPKLPLAEWQTALLLGASGGRAVVGTTYRGGVRAGWRELLEVAGGLVAEPDAAGREWEPELSALVRLNRYELGVVREWLPNSFGTVHTFRFGVTF